MSSYKFLASNVPLKEMKNPYIELLSIKEAIQRNLKIAQELLDNDSIDRDAKILLFCESSELFNEPEINEDNESHYGRMYTKKKFISSIQWKYTEDRAVKLIDYIQEHLKQAEEIELWHTWMDDEQSPTENCINQKDLTVADIKSSIGEFGFVNPKCLHIRK